MSTVKQLTWKRFCAGCYYAENTTHRYEVRSIEWHSEGMSSEQGWHLFCWPIVNGEAQTRRDGYCGTFWTARDAKAAAQEDQVERVEHPERFCD